MWLTSAILKWECYVDSWTGFEDESWRRAYAIWSHGERLLEQSGVELFRVDSITTLKRAIDHRLRHLDSIYQFRQIPIRDKPTGNLELLNYLGIIRPRMVQKLIEIRNAVEHQDADPPDIGACFDFLEFTWYFLRSTDLLVRRPIRSLSVDPPESELDPEYYGAGIEIDPGASWVPRITAWVVPTMLSTEPVSDWLALRASKTETRQEVVTRLGEPVDPTGWDSGRGKYPEDIYIQAEIRGPANYLLELYRRYFETV